MKVTITQECHVISIEEFQQVSKDLTEAFMAYAALLERYNYPRLGWGHHLRDLKKAYSEFAIKVDREVSTTVSNYLDQILEIRQGEGRGWVDHDLDNAYLSPVPENMALDPEYVPFKEWWDGDGECLNECGEVS